MLIQIVGHVEEACSYPLISRHLASLFTNLLKTACLCRSQFTAIRIRQPTSMPALPKVSTTCPYRRIQASRASISELASSSNPSSNAAPACTTARRGAPSAANPGRQQPAGQRTQQLQQAHHHQNQQQPQAPAADGRMMGPDFGPKPVAEQRQQQKPHAGERPVAVAEHEGLELQFVLRRHAVAQQHGFQVVVFVVRNEV